jgi:hypothetical protein
MVPRQLLGSLAPEILEPRRRQLGVMHGVRDVAVAQPVPRRAAVPTHATYVRRPYAVDGENADIDFARDATRRRNGRTAPMFAPSVLALLYSIYQGDGSEAYEVCFDRLLLGLCSGFGHCVGLVWVALKPRWVSMARSERRLLETRLEFGAKWNLVRCSSIWWRRRRHQSVNRRTASDQPRRTGDLANRFVGFRECDSCTTHQ